MLNPWLGVIASGLTVAAIWYIIDTLRTYPFEEHKETNREHNSDRKFGDRR